MKKPLALLFDLDGVLIRSHDAWFFLLKAASHQFGGREVTREAFEPLFGQGPAADIDTFQMNCTEAALNQYFFDNFPRYAEHLWVNPEAAPLLEALAERGFRRALVTNTMRPLAERLLAQAGLTSFFEVVVGADQVAHAKPAPDLLLRALRELGLPPEAAWMVGDSRYDREAARAAQTRFVGFQIDGDDRIDALSRLQDLLNTAAPQSP